jgi:hypothetical protein
MATPLDFILGVLGNATWSGIAAWWRRATGRTIRITFPLPGQSLRNPEVHSNGIRAYAVRGTLRHLPPGHSIWLLTQREIGDMVWPQGFRRVRYDRQTGDWEGWINGRTASRVRFVAVVAPPDSNDLFNYWQEHGAKTQFAPIPHLPADCTNKVEMSVDLQP